MDPDGRALGAGLPALALSVVSSLEADPEQALLEVTRTLGVVGGKLDQS